MRVIIVYPQGVLGMTEDKVMPIEVPEQRDGSRPWEAKDLLEMTFRMMNAVDGSDLERFLKKYHCRSMSVGDLANVKGQWYKVEMVGWSLIDDQEEIKHLDSLAGNLHG